MSSLTRKAGIQELTNQMWKLEEAPPIIKRRLLVFASATVECWRLQSKLLLAPFLRFSLSVFLLLFHQIHFLLQASNIY